MPSPSDRPLVNPLAMVLCETISQDLLTGRLHLHGIASTHYVPEAPSRLTFAVYASLSEVREELHAHFRVVDASGNHIDESTLTTLRPPPDPLSETTVATHLVDVEFPQFGHFFVQLWVNGRYIMERRLAVSELGESK